VRARVRLPCTLPAALAAGALLLAACGGRSGALEARGTLELTQVDLAPPAPARVLAVRVEEGAQVRAGDTLVVLSQATLGPELAGARARVAQAEARARDLRAGPRTAEIERAEAELASAEAEATRLARDLERLRPLEAGGAVSRQQLDAAVAAARGSAGRRDAAREALRLLRQGTRAEQVRAAEADVAGARAGVARIEAAAGDLVLLAPVDGTVLGRWAEPGEMLAAGVPALTLGETARTWVRVYVPARALDRVRPGQAVQVALADADAPPLAGTVQSVSPRAEFTPRVALTEDERADLLFGVRIAVRDSAGRAKAGLPATVRWP
jgi:HlyD family secretion protein